MTKLLKHLPNEALPDSLVQHLLRIKQLVMTLNPRLKTDYLANMLNAALAKRVKKVGLQAYAKHIADDAFPDKLVPEFQQLMPRGFGDLLKCEGGQSRMTHHALMLLLEDGLHPMASLSGWIVGASAQEDLDSSDSKFLIAEQSRLLFAHRSNVVSPFYQPAILVMEEKSFWSTIAPLRAARQLHRFALHLSKDDDLLAQMHREFFDPKSRMTGSTLSNLRLNRARPLENQLQSAIGRVLDLHPDLDAGRIDHLMWPHAILRNWVFEGHISELGPEDHPAEFIDEMEWFFRLVPAVALHYLPIYEGGHPLAEQIEQAFLKSHEAGEERAPNPDSMVTTHPYEVAFRPDLATRIGQTYESLQQTLFSDYWQHCSLDFIEFALEDFRLTWGRPRMSQDPALISVNAIGRHPEWVANNHDTIAPILPALLTSKKTMPYSLVRGTVPLSVIPQDLIDTFVRTLVLGPMSLDGLKRVQELVSTKRLDSDSIADLFEEAFKSNRSLPPSLVDGSVPLSILSDRVLPHFIKLLFKNGLKPAGFDRIDELITHRSVCANEVIDHAQEREDLLLLSKNKVLKKLIMETQAETLAEEIMALDLGL